MFTGTKLKGGSTVEELLNTQVPALCQGGQISAGVRDYADLHLHENHITVFELQSGRDYDKPEGSSAQTLERSSLKGAAAVAFAKMSEFGSPAIEFRLPPEGQAHFALVQNIVRNEHYLDGHAVARKRGASIAARSAALIAKGVVPHLVVVHAGDAPDDTSYRRELIKQGSVAGVKVTAQRLDEKPTVKQMREALHALNHDNSVHGVLVQTVRDAAISEAIYDTLSSNKDPEFINSRHIARVISAEPGALAHAPSTAASIHALIHEACGEDLKGKVVTIINGSRVIGRPLAMLLNADGATPIICNRHTPDWAKAQFLATSDVIVTATGRHGIFTAKDVKKGVVIVDAAIIRLGERIIGDLDTDTFLDVAAKITPVPGGVGPVTVAILLDAVVDLAEAHQHKHH